MRSVSALSLCLGVLACTTVPEKRVETAGNGDVMARPGDAPPHVFTARSHPPHRAPLVPPPNLDALPKLEVAQCFGGALEESQSGGLGLSGVGSGGGGLGHGSGRGTGGGFGKSSPPKRLPPQPSKPSAPVAATPPPPPSPPAGQAPPAARPMPEPAAPRDKADSYEAESAADRLPSPAAPPAEDWDEGGYEPVEEQVQIAAPEPVQPAPSPDDQYHDWGSALYLSNDDTMSLSSAQRVLYAIDRFMPLPVEHIRPHELLNYFSFDSDPVLPSNDFSVKAELQAKPGEPGIYSLALAVAGRPLDTESRRNAALSFVIDRSGSMSDEGRMDYLKHGLTRMTDELKTGDVVNLVLFDDEVCVPLKNFVMGRDSMDLFRKTIAQLQPRGSTDVHLGLKRGYELADRSYQAEYSNRVIIISDALANTGVTDENMIAMIGHHYDQRRIRLSGVGVGSEFNDALLDRLTERGKGAYVFLGSEAEVNAVFGDRFVSLIETVANDVHFKLNLPPSLRMNVFYGEESSTVKEDVQAIHYFAGTGQLFLSDLMARGGAVRPQDSLMLTIEYEHPETGQATVEEFAFNLGNISEATANVRKARLVTSFADGLYDLAQRVPERQGYELGSWVDPPAYEQCQLGKRSLREQSVGLDGDAEVQRVIGLWDRFCSRYEEARQPVTREQPRGRDVWPGAQ
jgi:hypothetical protein